MKNKGDKGYLWAIGAYFLLIITWIIGCHDIFTHLDKPENSFTVGVGVFVTIGILIWCIIDRKI